MESTLRDAIAADPTAPAPRLALAELWAGRPEAELIGILMEPHLYRSGNAIGRWFTSNYGWHGQGDYTPCACDGFFVGRTINGYMQYVFDTGRWSDRGLWHAGVIALARRMLPNAREWLAVDDPDRIGLERVVTSGPDQPPPLTDEQLDGPQATAYDEYRHREIHHPALTVLLRSQAMSELLFSGPGDSPGDWAILEMIEQLHLLGWSWLGLPPLRPEVPVQPNPDRKMKDDSADSEGWPDERIAEGKLNAWWRRLLG